MAENILECIESRIYYREAMGCEIWNQNLDIVWGARSLDQKPKYKRVVLKLSGEALGGESGRGFDIDVIRDVCQAVKACSDLGVQTAVVVGGGNFWRGAKDANFERARSDQIGMLSTVMNSLALSDVLESMGADVRVQTAIEMKAVAEPYMRLQAIRHLERGRIVIFGCGTGHPYFTTDTAAVLRAAEIGAEAILLAKNIDGVYNDDPAQNPDAVKYDTISFGQVLQDRLGVMDLTATSMAMESNIPVVVFALEDPQNILRAVRGEAIGTLISGKD